MNFSFEFKAGFTTSNQERNQSKSSVSLPAFLVGAFLGVIALVSAYAAYKVLPSVFEDIGELNQLKASFLHGMLFAALFSLVAMFLISAGASFMAVADREDLSLMSPWKSAYVWNTMLAVFCLMMSACAVIGLIVISMFHPSTKPLLETVRNVLTGFPAFATIGCFFLKKSVDSAVPGTTVHSGPTPA